MSDDHVVFVVEFEQRLVWLWRLTLKGNVIDFRFATVLKGRNH